MAKKYIIKQFKPPHFTKRAYDHSFLETLFKKRMQYASLGRYALYHVLQSFQLAGKTILIPAYLCDSVLIPLRKLGMKPIYYDIDLNDLNPSFDSIQLFCNKYEVDAVLVPSMYGMPADLESVEAFCKERSIVMIDDAAQSFGSSLNNRIVGSFGNAGFFSFSPGKRTAGHMGAFFWTSNNYEVKRTSNPFYHYLQYLDFYFNRLNIYNYEQFSFFKSIRWFKKASLLFGDIINDRMNDFEKPILAGILDHAINSTFQNKWYKKMIDEFSGNSNFRVIQAIRGRPAYHKFILDAHSKNNAAELMSFLDRNRIYCTNGYHLLSRNFSELKNCAIINGRIVEIPIEDDNKKMDGLLKLLQRF